MINELWNESFLIKIASTQSDSNWKAGGSDHQYTEPARTKEEMRMILDTQELRSWVYAFLREESKKLRQPQQLGLQLADVERHVKSAAQRVGKLPQDTLYGVNDLPHHSSNAVREVMWSLVIQGIIVPGVDKSSNNAGFPFFQITEWGEECLAVGEYVPYDTGQYMRQIRSDISTFGFHC